MLAISTVVLGGGFAVYRFFWSSGDLWKQALSSISKLWSPQLTPGTQPSPPPSRAKDAVSRVVQVNNFVERYDGGDCFFVMPVAVSQNAAVIEGYGASTGRFQAFVDGFKREQGFEPSVGIRQVTQEQCPALRFLSQLHGDQSRAPRITLAATEVKNGETLSGTIENFENGVLELLLVTDKGQIRNLSNLLKPSLDSMSFSIGLQSGDNSVRPQLLLALSFSQSLGLLKQPQLGTADEFFGKLLSEARRNSVTVAAAVRYFKLDG